MDWASRDTGRHGEPAADDGDGTGDISRALDQVTTAYDDERVRRVIDALIHPAPDTSDGPTAAVPPEPAAPRAATAPATLAPDRPAATPDALGLCHPDAWRRLLEVEHACAGRYGARTTVIQLEVSGIAVINTVLGDAAADRLVGALADTVREDTRGADTFTRIGRWRVAGLLPYTDGRTADAVIRRIAEGFVRRVGGGVPVLVASGRAQVDPSLDPAVTLTRAEGAMTAEPRRAAGGPAGGGRADAAPADPAPSAVDIGPAATSGPAPGIDARDDRSRRRTDRPVPDSLRELERMRVDGLVTDEEYRKTRRRILRRI